MSFFAQLWGSVTLGPFSSREDARAAFLCQVHDAGRVQWRRSDDERDVELANDLEGELLGEVWKQGRAVL